ncbi:MAG: hypothetical protein Q3988_01525 [Gemella sp.]|nr:hypothetical protein [Gemella sp.]
MEAQYIETLIYSYIILICLIGLWMLLGLIGRLILTRRAEKS